MLGALTLIDQSGSTGRDMLTIRTTCPACTAAVEVRDVPKKNYLRWSNGGEKVQVALPMLTAADREVLLTGYCVTCFDKLSDDATDARGEG